MNDTAKIRHQIIEQLSDGKFHSGQFLANKFNLSRTAISNHIAAINELGLETFSVKGKGYQFSKPIKLLDQEAIKRQLTEHGLIPHVNCYSVINSTSDYLKSVDEGSLKPGQVCLAEYQSHGRGRRGRQWLSPYGCNLYFSMYWPLQNGLQETIGLSLTCGLAVSEAIKKTTGLTVQLKWPNDVYMSGKKLAGILIDLDGQGQDFSFCIIGIGVNVDLPEQVKNQIDQSCTDLTAEVGAFVDRNELATQLILSLNERLLTHRKFGFSSQRKEWESLDFFLNKPVSVITGKHETVGIYQGVDDQGALLLRIGNENKTFYGGEVSLRLKQ